MTTCETLPLPGFEPMESSASTPSAAASPAKTSRWLEEVRVCKESEAAFGESSPVYLASYDRDSHSWRTSGLLPAEDWLTFSETLPRSGSMRSGTLYLLPPLVRLIYATGAGSSLLIPTPTSSLGGNGWGRGIPSPETAARRFEQGKRNLDDWAALLPTPTASDYGTNQGGSSGRVGKVRPSLQTMARQGLIPTPTASDANSAGSRNTPTSKANFGVSLTDWARGDAGAGRLLPTPQAQDFRNCSDYSNGSRGHSPQLRHLGNGRLNPRFVEWMQGFPPAWTDLED